MTHIVDGEFQSDKYPTCPRGKVLLSVKDPMAQDLLWEYAQRRRAVDAEFADDLEFALRGWGYRSSGCSFNSIVCGRERDVLRAEVERLQAALAASEPPDVASIVEGQSEQS